MKRCRILPLLMAVSFLPSAAFAQEALGVLCIKGSNIAVRSKCLVGEKVATVNLLTTKGPTGDTGATGSSGAPGRQAVFTTHSSLQISWVGAGLVRTETCPLGKIVVGGGCLVANANAAVVQSFPTENLPNQWTCVFKSRTADQEVFSDVTTLAICIDS